MKNKIQLTKGKSHITFRPLNSWLGTIEELFVDEKNRREGIATKFLSDTEDDAIKRGIGKISLLCRDDNTPALSLYLKAGFFIEATLKQHYSADSNHYVLSKFIGNEK